MAAPANLDATVTLIDHLMQIFEDLIIPALLAWLVVVIRNWTGKLNIESPHPNDPDGGRK
jgi:hypothetical protein